MKIIATIAMLLAPHANALTVEDDHGGLIAPRVDLIASLRESGEPVRIVGRVCYSACTMYLGLLGACVSAQTRFGFHGPSSATLGIGLPRKEFEYWSQVMAQHYPANLRGWFMKTARHNTGAPYIVMGGGTDPAGGSRVQMIRIAMTQPRGPLHPARLRALLQEIVRQAQKMLLHLSLLVVL